MVKSSSVKCRHPLIKSLTKVFRRLEVCQFLQVLSLFTVEHSTAKVSTVSPFSTA